MILSLNSRLKKILLVALLPFTGWFFLILLFSCEGFFLTCTGDGMFHPYVGTDALLVINEILFIVISIVALLLHWYLILRSFQSKIAVSILAFVIIIMELPLISIELFETGFLLMLFIGFLPILIGCAAYMGSVYITGKRFEKSAMTVLVILVIVVSYLIIKYTLHPLGENLFPNVVIPISV